MPNNRDETLFHRLVDEHRGILLKVARSFAVSDEDRDDLLQDVLIKLWTALPSFREESKVSTWIYRIALNRALTWRRDETRRRARLTPLVEVVDVEPTNNVVLLDRLYAEIRNLGEVDRSLVLMSLDGCSYQEMSKVMGISESNVGVRLNRAKQKLSERMSGCEDE